MRPLTHAERLKLRNLRRLALQDLSTVPRKHAIYWHWQDEARRAELHESIRAYNAQLHAVHDEAEHKRNMRWLNLRGRLSVDVDRKARRQLIADRIAELCATTWYANSSTVMQRLAEAEVRQTGRPFRPFFSSQVAA